MRPLTVDRIKALAPEAQGYSDAELEELLTQATQLARFAVELLDAGISPTANDPDKDADEDGDYLDAIDAAAEALAELTGMERREAHRLASEHHRRKDH